MNVKIDNLKVERERTEETLAKYEATLEVLKLLLPKGWVAMDADGTWYWFKNKPVLDLSGGVWRRKRFLKKSKDCRHLKSKGLKNGKRACWSVDYDT